MKQNSKVKRFISLMLSLVMLLSLTAGLDLSAYAMEDDHIYYAANVVAPDGAKYGYTEYVCNNCGDSYKGSYTYNSLSLNTLFHVETDDEYGMVSFTPAEDGTYIIESFNYTNDPYVYLYEYSSGWNELNNNDDGGEGWNFKLSYELKSGKTYYYQFGRSYDSYDVLIKKADNSEIPISVEFIRNNNYEYVANTNGYFWKDGDEYFEYNSMCVFEGDIIKVNYKDGTKKDFYYHIADVGGDGIFSNLDDEEELSWSIISFGDDHCWYNDDWSLGVNYVTLRVGEIYCEFPITVVENPYESIEYNPVREKVIIENDEGYWETDENEDEYFDYHYNHYEIGDVLTVYYKDGTSVDYIYQCLDEKEEYYDFVDEDGSTLHYVDSYDNQYEEHWTVGSDNYYYIKYLDMAVSVPVKIIESPIESISYIPNGSTVLIEELSFGAYGPFWGGLSLSEEDNDRYYEYFQACFGVFKPGNKIIVNYKDGTQKIATCGSEVFSYTFDDGEELDIRIYSDQYEKHWTLGDDNYFELRYLGASCNVQVTIVKNPYNEVTFSGIGSSLKIPNEPYYDEYYEYDTYDVDYRMLQNLKLTLSGAGVDSKILNAVYDEYGIHLFDENGEEFNIYVTESQWYTPWVKDGDNYITVSVGRFSVDIPVEICGEIEDHTHSFEEIDSQAPTCTEEGYVSYQCKDCDASFTEYLDALGHNYKFTEYYDGIFYYQCEDCEKENKKLYSRLPDFNEEFAQKVIRGKGSMYLDFNNDDYVNVKDYLVLRDIMA